MDILKNDQLDGETKNNSQSRRSLKICLGFLYFLSAFIHTILEIFKEIFIITKQTPASIYFIKLFLTLPTSFLIAVFLRRSVGRYSLSAIYRFGIVFYLLFFVIFGLLVLPNERHIQKGFIWVVDITGDGKLDTRGLKILLPLLYLYAQRIYTIFYVVAEMWGSFMISYFLYLFANSMCTKTEMESILPYFSSISAISMMISALLYALISAVRTHLSYTSSIVTISLLFVTMSVLTLLLFILKAFIEKHYKVQKTPVVHSAKTQSSSETIFDLLKSRLLQNMAAIAMVYSFNSTIIESMFKNGLSDGAKLKNMSVEEYSTTYINLGFVFLSTYILSVNFFLFGWLKRMGWLFISLISPFISLFTGTIISCLCFYNFPSKSQKGLFFNDYLCDKPKLIDLEKWISLISCVLAKGNKYCMYDIAKERMSMRISDVYR